MKQAEEVMEILEAFDLVGTLRGAAELAGCDPKTVAHYIAERERAGGQWQRGRRARPRVDEFAEKIEEWVCRSRGKVRADKVHERLVAIGYLGSERTTRRAVAEAKRAWRRGHGRRTRPWIPEPGLWMQWDYAEGPIIDGRRTSLFCAWLAWSRYRVVLPLLDRTLPSVVLALDRALRRFGGSPTYALTDNERTVTADHVCGIAVRNPSIVAASRHYGLTVATCVPADPQSKGGSEATVRIAKADLVPTEHNLRSRYADFGELVRACEACCERVNAREHRITRRRPAEMLVEERSRLHSLPAVAHTSSFGETRKVSWQSTISLGGAIYSVPSELLDERVWARVEGSELVVVHADGLEGPREVARHELTTPGPPADLRRSLPAAPAGSPGASPASAVDRGGGVPRDRRGRYAVAHSGGRGRGLPGQAQAGRGGRSGQAARCRGGRPGASDGGGGRALRRWRSRLDPRPRHDRGGDRVPQALRRARQPAALDRSLGGVRPMSDYRDGVHCRIDPEQAELLADGSVAQEVSVIMTDDHRFDGRRGRHWRPPAICTLTPTEAREMAFELLCAAEHAERAGAGL